LDHSARFNRKARSLNILLKNILERAFIIWLYMMTKFDIKTFVN